jgi:hypothetical protein
MSGPLDFDERPAGEPRRPEPAPPAREPGGAPGPTPGGRGFTWVVGIGAVVLIAVLAIALLTQGSGRGARGLTEGTAMPPFAVPLVDSNVTGDANLARRTGEGAAGAVPACSLRRPGVLTSCALWERGPVVLAFFTPDQRCVDQLDLLQRAARGAPDVQVAAIAIRGDRAALRRLVRRHRWTFPVGWDRDGGLANAYHVQICPQMTFAARGGRVVDTTFGTVESGTLARRMARLRR